MWYFFFSMAFMELKAESIWILMIFKNLFIWTDNRSRLTWTVRKTIRSIVISMKFELLFVSRMDYYFHCFRSIVKWKNKKHKIQVVTTGFFGKGKGLLFSIFLASDSNSQRLCWCCRHLCALIFRFFDSQVQSLQKSFFFSFC